MKGWLEETRSPPPAAAGKFGRDLKSKTHRRAAGSRGSRAIDSTKRRAGMLGLENPPEKRVTSETSGEHTRPRAWCSASAPSTSAVGLRQLEATYHYRREDHRGESHQPRRENFVGVDAGQLHPRRVRSPNFNGDGVDRYPPLNIHLSAILSKISFENRLSDLHQKGILTDEEYKTKKAELLSRL
jgi:Short C-terminal domain